MGIELAQTASLADLSAAQLHFRSNPLMSVLTAQLTQYSTITRIFKRLSDIFFSLIAIIISSPIMLVVALLIKHEDGGPVFFRQQRIGIYGKPFTMYKFRSMNVNAEAIKKQLAEEYGMEDRFVFKLKNDPRVTRIGHFIRKTSIDEIPQFFNVLKGDMSLVGPRPPLPEEVARYGTLYSARLLVKPGITGPWQVSGRSNLTQEQSEFVDVSYIQNWSLTGDIAILLKTVVAVVRGTGSRLPHHRISAPPISECSYFRLPLLNFRFLAPSSLCSSIPPLRGLPYIFPPRPSPPTFSPRFHPGCPPVGVVYWSTEMMHIQQSLRSETGMTHTQAHEAERRRIRHNDQSQRQ